jgi:hypothetical protein
MRKETVKLLALIDEGRKAAGLKLEEIRVRLEVRQIQDEDPGVNFMIYDKIDPAPKYDSSLRLYKINPLLFRRAVRRAEGIALEAWAYLFSQGTTCEVRHYPISLT